MTFTDSDIAQLEQRYRTTLANALSGFKPLFLLGSVNAAGVNNLSLINSVVHIGANPFMLGFILRPTTVSRHSYDNIHATNSYTLNAVSDTFVAQAHHASAKFDAQDCEFKGTGLTPEFVDNIMAPFVAESQMKMALVPTEEHVISNGTILVIGKVIRLILPNHLIGNDGFPHLERAGLVSCVGLDAYYKPSFIARYEYARPERSPLMLPHE